jgi:hypothetical protein
MDPISLSLLADELKAMRHPVSHASIGTLLGELVDTLSPMSKRGKGKSPDRKARFEYINPQAEDGRSAGIRISPNNGSAIRLIGVLLMEFRKQWGTG